MLTALIVICSINSGLILGVYPQQCDGGDADILIGNEPNAA